MPNDKKEPKASDILRALHDLIQVPEEDVAAKPPEEVRAELKRRGINAAPLIARVKGELAKAKANVELSTARLAREKSLARLKALQSRFVALPRGIREHALSTLELLSSRNPATAAAYFSKFEKATDADLQSLLEDLSHLDESHNRENPSGTA